MKKDLLKIFAIITVIGTITVYAVSATVSGSFSLTYGKYDRSDYAQLENKWAYVNYEAHKSDSTKLRVTLSKKSLFGFSNEQVINAYFSEDETKKVGFPTSITVNKQYLITQVNDKENSVANASYEFYSESN